MMSHYLQVSPAADAISPWNSIDENLSWPPELIPVADMIFRSPYVLRQQELCEWLILGEIYSNAYEAGVLFSAVYPESYISGDVCRH